MTKSWIDEALAQSELGRDGLAAEGRRQLPLADREQQVLDRIDRARRRRPKVREERITMSHGSGGKATHTLIEAVFLDAFRNPLLEPLEDAARLAVGGARIALTTDSYVVSPLFFPGGDIGDLAVNGTVNDLSVAGARPLYLSAGFILEEGFPVADLQRVTESMRAAAASRIDPTIRCRSATGKPSSRMKPAVRYSGVAPDTARSLTCLLYTSPSPRDRG